MSESDKKKTAPKSYRLDVNSEPRDAEGFIEMFGNTEFKRTRAIIVKTVEQRLSRSAVFSEKNIVDSALQGIAQIPDVDDRFLRHPFLESLLRFHFNEMEWKKLDNKGNVTHPQWWLKEEHMISMAGEKTLEHYLPQHAVSENLGLRTWIPAGILPPDFLAKLKEFNPAADGKLIPVKYVVDFARQEGMEVFGVELEWNDELATGISGELVGTAQDFIDSIEDAKNNNEDWFIKPVLFVGDDWKSSEAKKLKKYCKDAGVEAWALQREGITGEQVGAVFECTYKEAMVSNVVGMAGTGKTFSVKTVCDSFEACGYDIMGAALGWSAAKVLSGSAGLPNKSCRALEGFIGAISEAKAAGVEFFVRPTLIVVDESGMVGVRHMHALLELAHTSKQPVKIVLTGDPLQVAPVEAGSAFATLIDRYGAAHIKTIRRQKQPSHRQAVMNFALRNSGAAMHTFMHQEMIHVCPTKEEMFKKIVQEFVSYRVAFPDKKCLILALENKDVLELNQMIRLVFRKAGLLHPDEVILDTTDGTRKMKAPFSVGDEVQIRSNDVNLPVYDIPQDPNVSTTDESQWTYQSSGVFNRNSGRIVAIKNSQNPAGSFDFVVDLEGEYPARVVLNSRKFKHPDRAGMPMVHNYGATVYSAQGMTFPHAFVVDASTMNFRTAYVGCSRHTEGLDIFINETEVHRRLDAKSQRSADKKVKTPNGDLDEVLVKLGRYTRTQIIQSVSLAWRNRQDNFTAHSFKEMGDTVGETYQQRKHFAELRPLNTQDLGEVDFIKEFNMRYPRVDIQKIMSLPEPIGKSEYWRPSDVDEHRASIPVFASPILDAEEDSKKPALSSKEEDGESLLLRAANVFRRFGGKSKVQSSDLVVENAQDLGVPVQTGVDFDKDDSWMPRNRKNAVPFQKLEGKDLADKINKDASLIEKVDNILNTFIPSKVKKPKGLADLPLLPMEPLVGEITDDGLLKFTNVPQSVQEDGSYAADPSEEFLMAPSTKMWWDVGRENEPRILARDTRGVVQARYRLDGECVVGDGFPPFMYSPNPKPTTPVMIVPGPKEWFLLQEHFNKKEGGEEFSKMPHIIWGAKDADWSHIRNMVKNKELIIVRSRTDESQIPWALDLKKELETKYRFKVRVSPVIPGHENDIGYHERPNHEVENNGPKKFNMSRG